MSNKYNYYTDKNFIYELYKLFIDVHNILVELKIPYYASGGSLIGSLRHKGIIPWDDDLDIEIGWRDIDSLIYGNGRKLIKSKNLKIQYVYVEGSKNHFDWIKIIPKGKKNIFIDIFPMKLEKDSKGRERTYFWSDEVNKLWPKYYLYKEELLPLKMSPFGDGYIVVPNKANKALSRAYGKDWKNVGYIIQDKNHVLLDKKIKLKGNEFEPAKKFYSAKKQKQIEKNSCLLTLQASSFY